MRTDEQQRTIPGPTTRAHEHGWCTESTHRTSEGVLRYVRCAGCGARRMDLEADPSALPGTVPAAASRVLGGGADTDRTIPAVEQRS